MAAHAIKAGEGDVFVAAGVETVSRYRNGACRHRPAQPALRRRRGTHRGPHTEGRRAPGRRAPGLPDIYIAMGQTAENVAEYEKVTREEMDEFALLSQTRAVAVPGERLLRARDHPGHPARRHGRHQGRRPPGQHHARGARPAQAGLPRGRHRHRRQRLPAQRRRRRGDRHERHQGASSSGITPLARIVASGVTGLNPEIMGLGPVEACRQALKRAEHDDRRHRPGRDQRGLRRPGGPLGQAPRHQLGQAQRARAAPSRSATPSARPGARIMTTLLNALEDTRQDHRPRVDVRRRRPGHGHDRRAAQLS